MQDVLLKYDTTLGVYDLQLDSADFASVDGMETAIVVSLFTDSRAPENLVPTAQRRRGWIGNILTVTQRRELGSILWTLDQARITQNTLNNARVYAQGCFNWMVDDGIARSVSVDVVQQNRSEIVINIEFTDLDNKTERYTTLWRATSAANLPNI
jgi:phage gp46-like protein